MLQFTLDDTSDGEVLVFINPRQVTAVMGKSRAARCRIFTADGEQPWRVMGSPEEVQLRVWKEL